MAVDAVTGKEIWVHDDIEGFALRGVNYWESADGSDRRLLFSAKNMLYAIDARTGKSIPTFGENGRVDLRKGLDRDPETVDQQSRLPGKVFENLIILGSATNQEYKSAPGDIRAFDVRTGALVWSFHTVPRAGELGADTWPANARATDRRRQRLGGAHRRSRPRHRLRSDGECEVQLLRRLPARQQSVRQLPSRARRAHRGAGCGISRWCTTTSGMWTTTPRRSSRQFVTADGRWKSSRSRRRPGYLYVFDRLTGTPVWPIEERPVPQGSNVPGEKLSPTQPFPTNPPPFVRQSFTAEDLNPYIL